MNDERRRIVVAEFDTEIGELEDRARTMWQSVAPIVRKRVERLHTERAWLLSHAAWERAGRDAC
ncbi:MAG: hypothetical protein JW951_01425 [Lentisphaerae bacterium]|nr:hypothetical protein [Lentisphaerota bacterium]